MGIVRGIDGASQALLGLIEPARAALEPDERIGHPPIARCRLKPVGQLSASGLEVPFLDGPRR